MFDRDFLQTQRVKYFLGASVAFLVICIIATFMFSDGSEDYGYASDSGAGGSLAVEPSNSFSKDSGFASRIPVEGAAPEAGRPEVVPEAREVITEGSMTVKVKDPVEQAEDFTAWVNGKGGYVENLQADTYEDEEELTSQSTLTVRLEDIDEAVAHLKKLPDSKVLSENVSRFDVTLQAADLDARIDALELSIERLEKFVAEATTYDELFRAETELTNRQSQLDSLNAQRKALTDQVQLQTLTVTFTATERASNATDRTGRGFTDGILDGWNSLVSFVATFVYASATLIPWLVLLVPVGLLALLALKLIRRRRDRNVTKAD